MGDVTYLRKKSRSALRLVFRRTPVVPPRQFEQDVALPIPMRYWGRDDLLCTRVVGDAMCPTLLDNDILVMATALVPLPHDIVAVSLKEKLTLPGVTMAVARYNFHRGHTFLTKDHPHHGPFKRKVTDAEVLGVGIEILPRSYRSPSENHFKLEITREKFRCLSQAMPSDLGLLSPETVQRLTCALDLPDAELLDGRLPSGYFRAFAKASQPHVGIGVRDLLTIDPTAEPCVGDLVIQTNEHGGSRFGVVSHDVWTSSKPGPSRLGSTCGDSSIRGEAEDWHHVATIMRVDRPNHVALAAGRTEIDRRSNSGGRPELL